MKIIVDDKKFMQEMNNFIAYAEGFLDGAKLGKPKLLRNLGEQLKQMIGEYIDASARINPSALHHVYEWYQVGRESARLFDIQYNVEGGGLSINSTFSQSVSVPSGSKTPFYNKAQIMEAGVPVTIVPTSSNVLAFEQDGQTVFTRKPVTVENPGGEDTAGSFEATFKEFFMLYASQSLMFTSGLGEHLKTPLAFKRNAGAGKRGGYSVGVRVGQDWISGGIKQ
jgi:hypothetical protein